MCGLCENLGKSQSKQKINQINHLANVLQANIVLNEQLARGYESEV